MNKLQIFNFFTEKKLIIFLMSFLILTTIADMYTALSTPIFKVAETNPLYLHFGLWALTGVILVTIILAFFFLKGTTKFLSICIIIMFIVYTSYGHILGTISNVKAYEQYKQNKTDFIEKSNAMSKEAKVNYYNNFVLMYIFIPWVLSFICFLFIHQLYYLRKPKREKIIDEIILLCKKLEER